LSAEATSTIHHGLVRQLADLSLLDAKDVIGGDLVLRDMSRRNSNVLIERQRGPSHFVKLASGPAGVTALRDEMAGYRVLDECGVAVLAPRVERLDEEAGLLALEGFPHARDLRTVHLQEGTFPTEVGALLGDALGRLHNATMTTQPAIDQSQAPWALSMHRPRVDALREMTPSTVDLVKVIQSSGEIGECLDGIREAWQVSTLTHGDLKWDNVILRSENGELDLKLVDWEHARAGDPLWDVGAAIAGYLSFWVFSIDAGPDSSPEALEQLARYPIESMTPALAALWSAYSARRRLRDDSGDLAAYATRLAGARLLVAAYEVTQSGGSLNAHAILHLQLAANLLARPRDAFSTLGLA
jgi:Ser/Thr protein kinase RdoA (MazF antagonist)